MEMKSKSKKSLCLIFCFMLLIVYVNISRFMLCIWQCFIMYHCFVTLSTFRLCCIIFSTLVPLLDLVSWYANDTLHWAYELACLNVHSLCEWSLWSLFIMIVHVWSSHALLLHSLLLDRIVLTSYAFQDFYLQWSSCVIVFRKTCPYGSRAS